MVTPTVGSIVLVPFPFSDLSTAKLRPALVIACSGNDDWVCVQITSNPYADSHAITLNSLDFQSGSLYKVSYLRPGKLFTAHASLFRRSVGKITHKRLNSVLRAIIALLKAPC